MTNQEDKPLQKACAELLAHAVLELFPGALLVDSFCSEIDFFYDFVMPQRLDNQSLVVIEEEMRKIAKTEKPGQLREMMRENAAAYFLHQKQSLKSLIINECEDPVVSIFQRGAFADLVELPIADETGFFKLYKVENVQEETRSCGVLEMTRIHGTSFSNKQNLKFFLKKREKAGLSDHTLLGEEMELFFSKKQFGKDAWFWLPKGQVLRDLLRSISQEGFNALGYESVKTPSVVADFSVKEGGGSGIGVDVAGQFCRAFTEKTILHSEIFKNVFLKKGALRLFERFEEFSFVESKKLLGLLSTRLEEKDVAHAFVPQSQLEAELISSLHFIDKIGKMFEFESQWRLCLGRPKKVKEGDDLSGVWKEAGLLMKKVLEDQGVEYLLDKSTKTASGPYLEVSYQDFLGRKWPCGHLAIDVQAGAALNALPGLHQEVGAIRHLRVLSFSLFGSLERVLALLLERFSGELPFWLAPEQVRVIPMAERHALYAGQVRSSLEKEGVRCGFDDNFFGLKQRVHLAEKAKVPFLVVVGDQEESKQRIAVRACNANEKPKEKALEKSLTIEAFLASLKQGIAESKRNI